MLNMAARARGHAAAIAAVISGAATNNPMTGKGFEIAIIPADLGRFRPGRMVRRTTFLEKELPFHPFGIALQGQCPVLQMGQDERCNPAVVFQDVGLRETIGGIEVLFKVR